MGRKFFGGMPGRLFAGLSRTSSYRFPSVRRVNARDSHQERLNPLGTDPIGHAGINIVSLTAV
ncbi:MAG: hypothetical protein H6750_19435 [Nitrospiraceae bacterium]|nr:hypothetical protein [Nitrospiraceae bacterium]